MKKFLCIFLFSINIVVAMQPSPSNGRTLGDQLSKEDMEKKRPFKDDEEPQLGEIVAIKKKSPQPGIEFELYAAFLEKWSTVSPPLYKIYTQVASNGDLKGAAVYKRDIHKLPELPDKNTEKT